MNVQATSVAGFRDMLQPLGQDVAPTDLSDKERIRRAKQVFLQKLDAQNAVDLDTCIHCGMCAEACHFYEATQDGKYAPVYKFRLLRRVYRRELNPIRWLFRPFTRDIRVRDLEDWRHLVYDACTGCGRCDMMCPMGINISSLIRTVREGIAAAGLAPPELQALQQEQQTGNSLFGVGADRLRALVEQLGSQGVSVPLDRNEADVMLLTTATEVLLFPDAFAANARILNKSGVDWTVCSDAFEAANIGFISGDDPTMNHAVRRIVDKATALGIGTLVLPESGHGYEVLRWDGANEVGGSLPFEVLSMPEFIVRELGNGHIALKQQVNGASVTYHDPCHLGRKGGVYEEPRDILKSMGYELRETEANRRENYCCGGGCGEFALATATTLRQKAFEIKKHQFDETGADTVVTGCANCRYNLLAGAQKTGWDTPVTSLVETVAASLAD